MQTYQLYEYVKALLASHQKCYNPYIQTECGWSDLMETHKATILEAVRMRGETDRMVSPLWMLSPLLGIVVLIVMMVLGFLVSPEAMLLFTFAGLIIYIVIVVYPLYLLIKRRSAHFRRDATLRSAIIEYLKARAASQNVGISSEVATMNVVHSESLGEEREKSAVMWTILSVIVPFVGIYVLYFLTKDPPNHDHRQLSFMQQAQSAASKLGMTIVVPTWKSLPGRSFFLYFIITIITVGLFGIYWYYVLFKDFNEHFKAQWIFEDQLVSTI